MSLHIHNRFPLVIMFLLHVEYIVTCVGPLSNLRKNEMHLGKQPKLINHGNPVSSVEIASLLCDYCSLLGC